MPELKEELEGHGIDVIGEGGLIGASTYDKPEDYIDWETIDTYETDPEIEAVVQGSDYTINYSKVAIASLYL